MRQAAPRIGIPADEQLLFADDESADLFRLATERLRALGAQVVEIDLAPFRAAGDMLYGGPWVAERFAAVGEFIRDNPGATVDPVVRRIILAAEHIDAVSAYRGQYALDALIRTAAPQWDRMDALMVPTVPFAPTIAEVADDPVGVNATLGTYTNFVNLMDLCAARDPGRRTRPPGSPSASS